MEMELGFSDHVSMKISVNYFGIKLYFLHNFSSTCSSKKAINPDIICIFRASITHYVIFICRKDGNQFDLSGNDTIAPARPPHSPVTTSPSGTVVPGTPSSGRVPSGRVPTKPADEPTASKESSSGKSKKNTKRVIWITISGVLGFIILALALVLFLPRCSKRERGGRTSKQHQIGAYGGERTNPWNNGALVQPPSQTQKGKFTCVFCFIIHFLTFNFPYPF
jgi:hypothetical protein